MAFWDTQGVVSAERERSYHVCAVLPALEKRLRLGLPTRTPRPSAGLCKLPVHFLVVAHELEQARPSTTFCLKHVISTRSPFVAGICIMSPPQVSDHCCCLLVNCRWLSAPAQKLFARIISGRKSSSKATWSNTDGG
ncbi:hypothetical protein LIA77_01157 [Sarocladium implicatum]|nr:hypothetical protein LIA77_01157 [Sarocladium implicatum]